MAFKITNRDHLKQIRSSCQIPVLDSENDFIDFANPITRTELGEQLELKPGIIKAQAQMDLFKIMFTRTKLLRNNRIGGAGTIGRTIVGAKGIGKSHTARVFVRLIESVWEDVYAVYANALDFVTLKQNNLNIFSHLMKVLNEERSLECNLDKDRKLDELNTKLKEQNKYLFIFIDELDQIYRQKDVFYLDNIVTPLSQLEDSMGTRVAAILCGSSAYLTELIKGNCTTIMKDTFLLFNEGSCNLNGTKYPAVRVYSNVPVDLATATLILQNDLHSSDISVKESRLVTFLTGANVRFVVNGISDDIHNSETITGHNSVAYGLSGVEDFEREMLKEIRKKLFDKNKELLISLDSIEKITTTPWENSFKPLVWSEIEEIYKSIAHQNGRIRLDEIMLHLSDRSFVVLNGVRDGHAERVYPITLYHLVLFSIDQNLAPYAFTQLRLKRKLLLRLKI